MHQIGRADSGEVYELNYLTPPEWCREVWTKNWSIQCIFRVRFDGWRCAALAADPRLLDAIVEVHNSTASQDLCHNEESDNHQLLEFGCLMMRNHQTIMFESRFARAMLHMFEIAFAYFKLGLAQSSIKHVRRWDGHFKAVKSAHALLRTCMRLSGYTKSNVATWGLLDVNVQRDHGGTNPSMPALITWFAVNNLQMLKHHTL